MTKQAGEFAAAHRRAVHRRFVGRRVCALTLAAIVLGGCAVQWQTQTDVPVVRIDAAPGDVVIEPEQALSLSGTLVRGAGDVVIGWDFGDGTTAEGAAPPAHVYRDAGTYVVTLSAVAPGGVRATPATRVIDVGPPLRSSENFALRFGGTGRDDVDRVKIPQDDPSGQRSFGANIGATDFTIEFWMLAQPGDNPNTPMPCAENPSWINGHIILDRDRWGPGRSYGVSLLGGVLLFGVTPENGDLISLCGSTRVDDGRWHHVAITREIDSGWVSVYVDGRLDSDVADGPTTDLSYPPQATPESYCLGDLPCTLSDPYIVLGAEKHDVGPAYPAFRGQLDELRLSSIVRYTEPFPPPSTRFLPDAATAALYHFDEGLGPVVRDSAMGPGAPTHGVVRPGGNPVGPVWVRSGAPTGP